MESVFDGETGELPGARMIGADVTGLIHGFAAAMSAEATGAGLAHAVLPHPAQSEAMHEPVPKALRRPLHH